MQISYRKKEISSYNYKYNTSGDFVMKKRFTTIIPCIFIILILYIAIYAPIQTLEGKLTLITLLLTTFIYYLQWLSMKNQEINSKRSFDNQEKILEAQKNIAAKQYAFDIFTLRLNLRNELLANFTSALSISGLNIADDVNVKLLQIGKNINDIKFAFPQNAKLTKYISIFKKLCTEFTNITFEKEVIIECGEKTQAGNCIVMDYKKCIRVTDSGKASIILQTKCESLNITNKEFVIITGIMRKYINIAKTKSDIENIIQVRSEQLRTAAQKTLDDIISILDTHIVINP